MNGKLIVIDGLDGCGKSTQAQMIFDELYKLNKKVRLISFPDYDKPSSALVKMYLNGDFSADANEVNPYAASSFYAVDRYASYKMYWQNDYLNGYTIIASRYVSSNAIHQMEKLDESQWSDFLTWLEDYEFNKLELPRPDKVIFLDMSRNVANKLISSRYNGDETKKDIHESNMQYMQKCAVAAKFAAKKGDWSIISCSNNESPLPILDINKKILLKVLEVLN
ncbi:MAG: deoxynucleoside kinase [Oscillospiraceae bacterium]